MQLQALDLVAATADRLARKGHDVELQVPAKHALRARWRNLRHRGPTFVTDLAARVTTANSKHCRSELREVSPAVWSSKGTNTLSATLKVTQAAGAPVVGQIHLDESVSVRPLIELFYTSGGDLVAGVEQCTAGGCETRTTVGHVNPGTRFSYVISYSHNKLTVSINGGPAHSLSTPLLGIGGYFKAGDYGQSPKAARVSFYSLKAVHGS